MPLVLAPRRSVCSALQLAQLTSWFTPLPRLANLFACIALITGLPQWTSHVQAAPPNIIIVMPDDVGYGDFACNGNPIIKTPAVDAFSKQSVRFTDFQVSPTCAPTRAALLTGRHEFKNGVTHSIWERERLALDSVTLADALKSAGYTTGIFGKWHLGDEAEYQPNRRGFDEVYIHGAGGIGQTYPGSCGDAPDNTNNKPAILHNGKFIKTDGYCTDLFFNQAEKWIAAQKPSQPFFAVITPNAAHTPHVIPEGAKLNYTGKIPANAEKFYWMIENIDDNFGQLLAFLEKQGLAENTLVIFMTDNGGTAGVPIFNAGMRGSKGTECQGGVRVPSFWRWPAGFAGNKETAALATHIDIFPTLAEIAGVKSSDKVKSQVEGRSLMPLLKNPNADWPNRTLVTHRGRWEHGEIADAKHKNFSIRDQQYALVNNKQLYDLKADPGQKVDVIGQHPEVVARLRKDYDKWWNEIQPLLVNENAEGPMVNPYKELYWKQFGGRPSEEQLKAEDARLKAYKKQLGKQKKKSRAKPK
ncbi:MAG: arylsulfatase [Planctomycetota bacterium]|nr:arylsulfatase [Planctomycetota bacterium]